MLDSREGVCTGQARFEYPATSALFSKCSLRMPRSPPLPRASGNQEQDIGRLMMMFGLGLSVGLGVTDSTVEAEHVEAYRRSRRSARLGQLRIR
jgi:hypothetical protein